MANSSVAITPGSGVSIDGFTTTSDTNFRQAIVVGDPDTDAAVAAVTALYGLSVDVKRQAAVITFHRVAAGAGDAVNIKSAAGSLRSVHMFNRSAVPVYVKFHNVAVIPTVGAGVVLTFGVQAGTQRDVVFPGGGRSFATGIGITIVAGIADANAVGVTADDAVVEVTYE